MISKWGKKRGNAINDVVRMDAPTAHGHDPKRTWTSAGSPPFRGLEPKKVFP